MKKPIFLVLMLIFLSGCATYKFHHGKPPYDKGYVVSRDDYTIIEYTVGPDNNVPSDQKIAKERFLRRRNIVEDYYKRMGYIENRFKAAFWNYWCWIFKTVGGVFRLPFIAISDYRYEHDPAYREKMRKIDLQKEIWEETRIKSLKEKLNVYIQKDLTKEASLASKVEEPKVKQPVKPKQKVAQVKPKKEEMSRQETISTALTKTEEELQKISKPAEQKREKVKPIRKDSLLSRVPVAVIIAKPLKGYSPLKVHFYGYKSHSPFGRIVSYEWDFGDQDTSTKKNPVNTYLSTTYGSVYFTVTLTVKDEKGNTASCSQVIEVMTK
jgi:hypothetical protein